MFSSRADLEHTITHALRHKMSKRIRSGDDTALVASRIVDHLQLSNWRFTKGPPAEAPTTPDTDGARDQS